MARRLHEHRFDILDNPHGILFNPISVSDSLESYIDGRQYSEKDLFYLNELWNSWEHHTSFSDVHKEAALAHINALQKRAAIFIKEATHLMITLGSAYYYQIIENGMVAGNNHRAPSQWFEKKLAGIEEIVAKITGMLDKLYTVNPSVTVVFTVSPVRHYKDGLVENNRSKARIIEAVHRVCEKYEQACYFPAYELVVDVLRDHRYYDIDLIHPNYAATDYVWQRLVEACMDEKTWMLMKQVNEIAIARGHRPRFPATAAHRKFLERTAEKIRELMEQHPYLNLSEDLDHFTAQLS